MNFLGVSKGRGRFLIALCIGFVSGLLCWFALVRIGNGAGDFNWQLRAARDLLSGEDPYRYAPGEYNIPYPLPTALLALPLARLSPFLAGSLFFGVSGGLLAWLILRKGEPWRLLIFLSWPFFYALLFAQWSPLVACLYFTPAFLPMLLMKPQIALPLALTQRPNRLGAGLTFAVGIVSLVVYPSWPLVWLGQISAYQGMIPPFLILPLGPLTLLALLRYRDRKAWLLLLMAAMPQRALYDQLALLLVAGNRRETLAHFRTVAKASPLPVMVYNNPPSYHVDVTPEMLAELADEQTLVCIKESSGDPRRITDIVNACGSRYILFAGVDDLILECVLLGAVGWVSGLVNAFPRENRILWELAQAGDWTRAREVYRWYTPLLHLDTHPKLVQYIKLAAAECGFGSERTRPPRLPLEGGERDWALALIHRAMRTRPSL